MSIAKSCSFTHTRSTCLQPKTLFTKRQIKFHSPPLLTEADVVFGRLEEALIFWVCHTLTRQAHANIWAMATIILCTQPYLFYSFGAKENIIHIWTDCIGKCGVIQIATLYTFFSQSVDLQMHPMEDLRSAFEQITCSSLRFVT